MPHLPSYFTVTYTPCFGNANVAFTIFAIYLIIIIFLHICDIFARSKFVQTISSSVNSSKGKRVSKGVNPPHRS